MGFPVCWSGGRDKLKASHNFQDRPVISSFGLLSPAKGIEYGIEAIAKIAADFANVIYLILGENTSGCPAVVWGKLSAQSDEFGGTTRG